MGEEAEARRLQMHDTLVNHKRDVLMEHKVQSGVVHEELQQLASQREEIEAQKDELQQQLTTMESGVQALEEQLHEHSRSSAIQDGRVNVAHARKKKRLDEEYEALLEGIEVKRTEVARVDSKLNEIALNREEKEAEMKALERTLV